MQAAMRRILPSRIACLGALLTGALAPSLRAQEAVPLPPQQPRPAFEGAIGLQLNNGPEFTGSDLRKTSLVPGLYLRWGRISVATAGNFRTRHDDEVVRGLGAELLQRDHLRVQLGLRYDPGRATSVSSALAGLDPVRSTVRARLSVVWQPQPRWRLAWSWNNDVLARKGGGIVDVSVAHEWRLSERTRWSLGGAASWADERYMLARFGISPEAAARTGRPAYDPGAGWRDVALTTQLITDIDRRWSVWASGSLSRLVGPAKESPLTALDTQAAVGAGFAWRF